MWHIGSATEGHLLSHRICVRTRKPEGPRGPWRARLPPLPVTLLSHEQKANDSQHSALLAVRGHRRPAWARCPPICFCKMHPHNVSYGSLTSLASLPNFPQGACSKERREPVWLAPGLGGSGLHTHSQRLPQNMSGQCVSLSNLALRPC